MAEPGIERRGLRDAVHERLLTMLLETRLAPGMRLSIDGLARDLDVSQTPVREALVLLERTGLVERVAQKGYRVAEQLTRAQMDELLEMRELLEVAAAERAARGAVDLAPALREVHEQHAALLAEPVADDHSGHRKIFEADWAFHRVILDHAANRFLSQMADDLGAHVHRMRQTIITEHYDLAEALAEHAAILAAFEAGGDGAADAMRAHMEGVRRRARRESD